MSNYKIHPSDDVKQNNDTAVTETSTVIDGGTAKHVGTTSTVLDNSGLGLHDQETYGAQVVGGKGLGTASWGALVGSVTVAASGDFAEYTKTSHGLEVGDVINVTDTNSIVDGPQKVTSVGGANDFVTDCPYVSGAGTVDYQPSAGSLANQVEGVYYIRRVNQTYALATNTDILRSGASDWGIRRSIHKVETGMRHLKVATAIRAGYWDIYNGVFTTAPTNSNDSIGDVSGSTVTDGTADHAATPTYAVPGELVYRQSGKPTGGTAATDGARMDDYKAKTG